MDWEKLLVVSHGCLLWYKFRESSIRHAKYSYSAAYNATGYIRVSASNKALGFANPNPCCIRSAFVSAANENLMLHVAINPETMASSACTALKRRKKELSPCLNHKLGTAQEPVDTRGGHSLVASNQEQGAEGVNWWLTSRRLWQLLVRVHYMLARRLRRSRSMDSTHKLLPVVWLLDELGAKVSAATRLCWTVW